MFFKIFVDEGIGLTILLILQIFIVFNITINCLTTVLELFISRHFYCVMSISG